MGPNFKELRETLLGGYTGRIPIAEISIAREIQEAYLGRPIAGPEDTVDFYSRAGYDYVGFCMEIDFRNGTFPRTRSAVSPPPRFKSLKEAEDFAWPDPTTFDLGELEALADVLPPNMKIIPQMGGLFYYPSNLLGFEELCVAMITDPPFAKFVFEKVGRIVSGIFDKLARCPSVGAIWLSSDIAFGTSLMVSPESLRKYVFPWVKKIAKIAHRAELPIIFHSDGNLTEVIGDLVEAGIDALHPIEPQAMDIMAIRDQYGPRLSLVGNVDVDILISRSSDDVRREAGRLRESFGDQGGYVLGSGNSIPPAVPIENFKALIEP